MKQKWLPPHEAAYFVERLMVFLTSCDERRYGQWENVAWWDFIGAESRSEEYQKVVARGLTRSLVAAKETVASTRTIGNMAEAFVMNIMGRGNDGALDRVLDAPTNEAWIRPWVRLLKQLGVRFHMGQAVDALERRPARADRRRDGRATGAAGAGGSRPTGSSRRCRPSGCASCSRASSSRADPDARRDERAARPTGWSGIQFYLRKPVDITHGHVTFVDAPWALTALTQAQFWAERDFAADYGDGEAVDCLSVDISDWDTPGILYGKPAKRCTQAEIKREVWAQIKAHLEDTRRVLRCPTASSTPGFLDPGVKWNREPRAQHATRRRCS